MPHRRARSLTLLLVLCLLPIACERNGAQDPDPPEPPPDPNAVLQPDRATAASVAPVPESGVELGWGWDALAAEARPTICVEFTPARKRGQTKTMSMHEVSDSYELMSRMGMSASASVKTIGYSASGSASGAVSTNVTGFSSTFVLVAAVDNGVRYAAPASGGGRATGAMMDSIPVRGAVRLTPAARDLAARDLEAFTERCGDSYVAAIHGGARLTGIIQIEESSHAEQEKIAAELSASGWGADLEARIQKTQKTQSGTRDVRMSFYQTGGEGDAIPSVETLKEKLDSLALLAVLAPREFQMTVIPYGALENWPDRELPGDPSELDQLASYWGAYNTLYDETQQALDADARALLMHHPDLEREWVPTTDPAARRILQTLQDTVHASLNRIRNAAIRCGQDPEGCSFAEADILDPYAVRIRLPIPRSDLPVEPRVARRRSPRERSEIPSAAQVIVRYHVEDPAKRRCQLSVVNPGCLTNEEIQRWEARVEQKVVRVADPERADRLLMAGSGAESWLDPVPGTGLLWYAPDREAELLEMLERVAQTPR